jgi:site-specific DNA-methyltransferase (adenine-specific)
MIDLKNTIYNKDCIEIMRQIREKSIDLIVTDPPYLMNYKTGHRKDKNHKFCSTILNDDNFELISSYIKLAYNILKDNTAMYMFCNVLHFDFFKNELENTGFTIKNMIIWVKNNWTAGDLKNAYGR